MSKCPIVSVILTSYNKENYIVKSIESVLHQTYKDLELIIVDDGSTDKSQAIIKEYLKVDERVKADFFDENQGIPSAHNRGIDLASGKYIAMIDCDDFWNVDKLEKQIAILETNEEYGACFSWIKVIDELDQEVRSEECEQRDIMWNSPNHSQGEWLRLFFTEGCKLGNPSMVVRKHVLDEVGRYSYGLRQLQDYDLFIKILKKYKIYIVQDKLVNYRWFGGEIKNTSYDNRENANRTNIEYYLVCKTFFENMSADLFQEGFSKLFPEHSDNHGVGMLYNQVFLLKNKYLSPIAGKLVALEKLYLLLNSTNTQIVSNASCGMSSAEFAAELNCALLYDCKYYMPVDNEEYILKLKEDIYIAEREWYKCKDYVDELEEKLKKTSGLIQQYQQIKEESNRYINELEGKETNSAKLLRNYQNEIESLRQYIGELEKSARDGAELIDAYQDKDLKQNKYIKELEEKSKESANLIGHLKEDNENQKRYIQELETKFSEACKIIIEFGKVTS